jgi:membrane-bound lytic murein transglycosylase D
MTAAEAAQRVGMSEAELRSVNNIPPRMRVRAGSSLLVHRTAQRNADVPEHVADNGQLSLQPEVVLKRTTVRARKGENLTRLANRYGVSPVSVAGWNKLPVNAALKQGQRVTLMLPKPVRMAQAPAKSAKHKAAARPKAAATKATRTAAARPKTAQKTTNAKTAKSKQKTPAQRSAGQKAPTKIAQNAKQR